MLPIQAWLNAMNIEAGLPARPRAAGWTAAGAHGLRRRVGRGLIALGQVVAGREGIAAHSVSVGR
jgi:hypothetical protein